MVLVASIFAFAASLGAAYAVSIPEFEISPEVLLAGSPAAMLFAFLETHEDFSGAEQALTVLPSVCKTEGLDKVSASFTETRVDCNLTDVDPECFLKNLAGQVGKSWGTKEVDEAKAAEVIDRLLKQRNLTLQAAAVACAASPLIIPLLAQFGTEMNPVPQVIAEATQACRH